MFEKLKKIWAQLTAEQQEQGKGKAAWPDHNDRAAEHIQPSKDSPVVEVKSAPESPPPEPAHHPKKKRRGKSPGKAAGKHREFRVADTDSEFSVLFEGRKQESFAEIFAENLEAGDIKAAVKEKGDPAEPVSSPSGPSQPQMEIDLHGCTAEQAEVKIEAFIQRALYQGVCVVRIITGKGLHSLGPAVLPGVAENSLYELRKKKMVSSFSWEGGSKERKGALIVRLKNLNN
jgi:DNA-nicking Smr family endonuclease